MTSAGFVRLRYLYETPIRDLTMQGMGTHWDRPMSFMKIFTSELLNCPGLAEGTVISIDANICLVTSDKIPAYSGEMADAAERTRLSKVKLRLRAPEKSLRKADI